MSRHRWLTGLFPRAWRARYAEEFLALLEAEGLTLAAAADIVKTAAFEWAAHLRRHAMPAGPRSLFALSFKPSAVLPVLMSLAAFAMVAAYIAVKGVPHPSDENAVAHIFQILVVAQVPLIGFFALRWGRNNPLACLFVLAIQALALTAALLPVWYFHL
jgi:hypothetical protein